MNKTVAFRGFTSQPSDYECPDGDLTMSLNLINENGNMQPIARPAEIMQMPSEAHRIVFIHKSVSFKGNHYIFWDTSSDELTWKDDTSDKLTPFGSVRGLKQCNAIGNTFIAFSDSEIRYFLWSDSKYEDLGNSLPDVELSFGLVGHPRLLSKSDSRYSYGFDVDFAEGIAEADIRKDFSDNNKARITEQIMAKLNKFIREQTVDKGRFCFPFFVRYALRLYDDSLVCHSAPILMNPSTTPAPLVLWERATGKSSYTKAEGCDIMLVAAALDYQFGGATDSERLGKWKDIIKSVDVFISKPIYTYDQNGLVSNLGDTDNFQSTFIGKLYHGAFDENGEPLFYRNREDCMGFSLDIENSKDFLSRYMEWTYSRIYQLYFTYSLGRPYPGETFHLPEFSDDKNKEGLTNCSTFYKLHSIPIDEASDTERKLVPIKDDYLQSLTSREVMTDDYLSHDRLIADSSMAYNSRLNLAGVKRQLFKGFSPFSMFAFCDRCLTKWEIKEDTIFAAAGDLQESITATVLIKESGRTYSVFATSSNLAPWGSDFYQPNLRRKLSWGSYLFYPNVNAYRIIISSKFGGDGARASIAIDLKPHDFLNGAFAVLDYNSIRLDNYTPAAADIAPISDNIIDCENKIFTSEVNNPFFFPLSGINTIGTGKILGISTAAKALSQGQFGQFPLYAFTEDGVWALELSETGTYRARQPITRDVCINAKGITQIDSAVLFPSDRGIMLISGSETTCISEAINNDFPFAIDRLPQIDALHSLMGHDHDKSCLKLLPLSDFLAECRMIYDYPHQRIIVYKNGCTYAYVFSLKTKLWGMMELALTDNINSYPEALAVTTDGRLLNFSLSENGPVKGLLITRPLKLDSADIFKAVDSVIQRGCFRRGNVSSVLFGSRDLLSWHLVWSSRDHYMRSIHGSPYKYYSIALLCEFSNDESIFGASVQFTPKATNQPR